VEKAMTLQELESAISQLPAEELTAFARWFEDYLAHAWDRRIEADIKAGRHVPNEGSLLQWKPA
jgi:hypothetical protein